MIDFKDFRNPTTVECSSEISESKTRIQTKLGRVILVNLAWRGRNYSIKMFFPQVQKPSRREVQDQLQKVYPNSRLWYYQVSEHEPGETLLYTGAR
jgi:hypothetical protein